MEKELSVQALLEENERLNKLNSVKSDMISISAHQIRTSLSALKWIMKMFLDGDLGKLNTEQESLMRKAYEGNDRAIGIVSELLFANKTENVTEKDYKLTELDLNELIDDSIFDFSGEANARGMELIFLSSDGEILTVRADKEKIRVVFQNILENAIKYGNAHGKIFITLKKREKFVEVSVKDNGVIISEEGRKRIFEKFYRDPEAQKKEAIGSGIGLFTIKKIVEFHGGKIWFESSQNEGTTFFFTLPTFK